MPEQPQADRSRPAQLPGHAVRTAPQRRLSEDGPQHTWSALARLLPFIEQENLHKQIDFSKPYAQQPGVSSKRIATYVCPSEVNDEGKSNHWPLNYAVNEGRWMVLNPATGHGSDGAFSPSRGFAPRDFTDGMSNTLAVAEVKAYTSQLRDGGNPNAVGARLPASPAELVALGGTFRKEAGHKEWVDGKVNETGFTALFPPNTRVPYVDSGVDHDVDFMSGNEGTGRFTYAAVTSRSYHPGVVNALLMDGSVRSFSNSVSLDVWRALSTRAGGEVVSDD